MYIIKLDNSKIINYACITNFRGSVSVLSPNIFHKFGFANN